MPSRRVTQADVAAMAGVSQATVSLILNNSAPPGVRITEETRQRVLGAIRITGYSANPVAQRLAGGNNQILGVFTYESTFPGGGRDFYGPFLVGIEHAAEKLGVDILLFTSARVVDGRRRLAHEGWQRLGIADGCLLLGLQEDREELEKLLDTSFPFVFLGKRESEGGRLPYVGGDYVLATRRQVDRLVGLGHTSIGYVGPRATDQPTVDRLEGYRSAMASYGLRPLYIDAADVHATAEQIIGHAPTSVLVAPESHPDELADSLLSRGVAIPADLSMLMLGQPHHPLRGGLTWAGFVIPREEMGARALLLLSRLVAQRRGRGTDGTPPDEDIRQLLDCPSVDGDTLAPPRSRADLA